MSGIPTTPVPPVPSREAVDLIKRARKAEQRIGNQVWRGDGDSHIFVGLLIGELRVEVERLTNELAFERRDRTMADAAAESLRAKVERLNDERFAVAKAGDTLVRGLRATVAEQGAALAELDKDREAMTAYLEALRVTLGMQHEARDGLAKKILDRIAALASAQSREQENAT